MGGHNARICPVFFACGVYYTNCTNFRAESAKPLHGRFWGVLGGVKQKGGSEYRQNRSQPKTLQNLIFPPIWNTIPDPL